MNGNKTKVSTVGFTLTEIEGAVSEAVQALQKLKQRCGVEDDAKALMLMGFALGNIMRTAGLVVDTTNSARTAFPAVTAGYECGESRGEAEARIQREASGAQVH